MVLVATKKIFLEWKYWDPCLRLGVWNGMLLDATQIMAFRKLGDVSSFLLRVDGGRVDRNECEDSGWAKRFGLTNSEVFYGSASTIADQERIVLVAVVVIVVIGIAHIGCSRTEILSDDFIAPPVNMGHAEEDDHSIAIGVIEGGCVPVMMLVNARVTSNTVYDDISMTTPSHRGPYHSCKVSTSEKTYDVVPNGLFCHSEKEGPSIMSMLYALMTVGNSK